MGVYSREMEFVEEKEQLFYIIAIEDVNHVTAADFETREIPSAHQRTMYVKFGCQSSKIRDHEKKLVFCSKGEGTNFFVTITY